MDSGAYHSLLAVGMYALKRAGPPLSMSCWPKRLATIYMDTMGKKHQLASRHV